MQENYTIVDAKTGVVKKGVRTITQATVEARKKDLERLENIHNFNELHSKLQESNEQLMDLLESLLSGKSLLELIAKAKPILKERLSMKEELQAIKERLDKEE